MSLRSEVRSWQKTPMYTTYTTTIHEMLEGQLTDVRDPWPDALGDAYVRDATLSTGTFGMVVAATNSGVPCIHKINYIGRRIEKILESTNGAQETAVVKFEEYMRRLALEVYIIGRVRHENFIHFHAVLRDTTDYVFVLPRLYNLNTLIKEWRQKMNGVAIPATTIMPIIRQVLVGLDFLHAAGIYHRQIQADNIYLTRGGCVKLSHFSTIKLSNEQSCITPVGRKEYFCFEKQFNLCEAETRDECLTYDSAADVWAVGVLVLRMICFYPEEQWQRLPTDFSVTMRAEHMPFKWIVAEMTQLRVRARDCTDEVDLLGWLSDKIFIIDSKQRATAHELLKSTPVKLLCAAIIEDDKQTIASTLIHVLDWPNKHRLEMSAPNYQFLESKDIPAEFYWDEKRTWKLLEHAHFEYQLKIETPVSDSVSLSKSSQASISSEAKNITGTYSGKFVFSDAHRLLSQMAEAVTRGVLEWCDILRVDTNIREGAIHLMRKYNDSSNLPLKVRCRHFKLPDWKFKIKRTCQIDLVLCKIVQ